MRRVDIAPWSVALRQRAKNEKGKNGLCVTDHREEDKKKIY